MNYAGTVQRQPHCALFSKLPEAVVGLALKLPTYKYVSQNSRDVLDAWMLYLWLCYSGLFVVHRCASTESAFSAGLPKASS